MGTYLGSLNLALRELLESDDTVYLFGEDIADPYGGAFKVTRGLSVDYPDRVVQTPISEAGIVGLATGMAMRGLRPIVEIMFGDFLTLASDQIINHTSKFSLMYTDKVEVPLVVRTPMGGGRGYGPTHSQSLEKYFIGVPGLATVAPSHFHDPGQILKHAVLEDTRPVLFIEHKTLYPVDLNLSNSNRMHVFFEEESSGYPTAVVGNFERGKATPDIALVSYGGMSILLETVMERMAREEIWVLCLLPSLISAPISPGLTETIAGVKSVIIIEEGAGYFGWSPEILATMHDLLGSNCPKIRRITADPTIVPAARHMEEQMLPSVSKVEAVMWEALS